MNFAPVVPPLLALLLSPLLVGVINRTKAIFAGRNGPPLAQVYYDLRKLMAKGAVYSNVTTWLFRAGPIVSLAALILAAFSVPFATCAAPFHFQGDLIWFAYLLAVSRFFSVMSALDTGSSFEGMGASRDVLFSALSEPALLLGLAAVARQSNGATELSGGELQLSLTGIHQIIAGTDWGAGWLVFVLVAVSLVVVFLAENARIPVDDPDTHLELTMIHEVMSLDHGGPDLGLILYASALRLWVFGAVIVDVVLPLGTGFMLLDLLWSLAALFALAILVGVIESVMARLRMMRVPQLLVGATTLSGVALVLEYGGKIVDFAVELILVFVLLTDMTLLGTGRLATSIWLSAVQGMALGVLPLLVAEHEITLRLVVFACVVFTLKGLVFPRLSSRAARMADVKHEVEPIVGYSASILIGLVIVILSAWVGAAFPLPHLPVSPVLLPTALATILSGLFLIVSRRTVLTQVVGYLVLENGIYIFGAALAQEEPFLVEMGVLLDVFVAVFVMGIAIFHISREFDHIDVDQLTSLKD